MESFHVHVQSCESYTLIPAMFDLTALSGGSAGVLIGAYYDDDKGQNSGSVYFFERQKDGSWKQTQKVVAADGVKDDEFGFALALSGDTAVVGAYRDGELVRPGRVPPAVLRLFTAVTDLGARRHNSRSSRKHGIKQS